MLVFSEILRLHQRTNPADKGCRQLFEETDAFVTLFINIEAHLYLKLVWQGLDKLIYLMKVFLIFIVKISP